MLEEGKAISKIAKEVNITRQTVYRIKHDENNSFQKNIFKNFSKYSDNILDRECYYKIY